MINTVGKTLKAHRRAGLLGAAIVALTGFLLLKVRIYGILAGGGLIDASYDLPFNVRRNIPVEEAAIVYLDEASGKELGQPSNAPWDRSLHARLLERLKADQAKAVVFDILFTQPGSPEADQKFAEAMRSYGRVILGAEMVTVADDTTGLEANLYTATALSRPIDLFLDSAAGIGLVTHMIDGDRAVRGHLPTSHESPPSLAWAAAALVGADVTRDPGQQLAPRWINYYGPPGRIPNVSYDRVIHGDLPPGFFHNKVVFVGAKQTAGFTGTGTDVFKSPYAYLSQSTNRSCPGVEVHATIFLNLIRKDWLSRLSDPVQIGLVLLAGILFGYGLTLFRPLAAIGVAFASMGAVWLSAFWLFSFRHVWFAWLIPFAAQIPIALLYSIVVNWFALFVQKRLLEQSFAMHLPPKRIKQLLRHPELLKPGAVKQMLSIMFTDVEDFTKLSERIDADDLARVMNEYFETTITCVFKFEGCVIKLIGDAILAVWNAPDPQANHRELACTAAIFLNSQEIIFTGNQAGLKLKTRIGIHTGLANVGNFGSSERIDYTTIGENVNLASRLEGLNKYLGTDILVTRETLEGCSDKIVSRRVGHFRLKGFEKLVEVHALVGMSDRAEATRAWRESFDRALKDFQQKNLDAAETGFRCTLEMRPNDGPARFYLQQIAELREHPPGPDWLGEVELKDK